MRRLPAVLALVVLAALPASAPAAPPDLARGHCEVATLAASFSFNARSVAFGTGDGRMVLDTAAFSFVADVDCLDVIGNQATMIGTITQSQGLNPAVFTGRVRFVVEDNQGTAPD